MSVKFVTRTSKADKTDTITPNKMNYTETVEEYLARGGKITKVKLKSTDKIHFDEDDSIIIDNAIRVIPSNWRL